MILYRFEWRMSSPAPRGSAPITLVPCQTLLASAFRSFQDACHTCCLPMSCHTGVARLLRHILLSSDTPPS